MKTFNFPADKGFVLQVEDLKHLFDALGELGQLAEAIQQKNKPTMIVGSAVSSGSPIDYLITEGFIIWGGEVFYTPGIAATSNSLIPAASIDETDGAFEPRTLYDTSGASGSGVIRKLREITFTMETPGASGFEFFFSDLADFTSTPWVEPTIGNGYTDPTVILGDVRYRKQFGEVMFWGAVNRGTPLSADMFTLPVGFRPDNDRLFFCPYNASPIEQAVVKVGANGVVSLVNYVSLTGSHDVELSAIRFSLNI